LLLGSNLAFFTAFPDPSSPAAFLFWPDKTAFLGFSIGDDCLTLDEHFSGSEMTDFVRTRSQREDFRAAIPFSLAWWLLFGEPLK